MTIEESIHVTFDESNPKGLERKVDDLVGTLEDMSIHDERRIEDVEKDMPENSTHTPNEPHDEVPKNGEPQSTIQLTTLLVTIQRG